MVSRRGVEFHQDNARTQTSVVTRQNLWELGWEVLMRPPYSPDLAPRDYHLFLAFQNFLSGIKRRLNEHVSKMSKNGLKQISQEITVFNGAFCDLITQINWADIENCIDFLSKEMPDTKIVDNGLFDEIGRLNVHLNYNKLKQLEHQHAEID
ncbi:histone-lysine N-methyltransferase SETMAR [Trichonephila clavipes]|uniref:Histone-lysine N-methyltransferase SETMAR n=1 Tax=Trichonephila clavipes TaxID=2585209 RepID=A0A8X6RE70_TRICX|nr:histone-lysine N-methyltransferase SETMAR [Trichonephila clavipes]